MLYKKERQSAASLSALMAQTEDSMVCFNFRRPIDPDEPQDIIDAKLRDATIVEASRSFALYFGFENREDILGKHLLKLFGGTIPSWFIDYGQEVEDRNFENIERVIEVPVKGKMRPVRIYMQNIFKDGLLTSQWVTIRDISRESEQERVIEENERLKMLALQAVGLRTFALKFDPQDDTHPHGRMLFGTDEEPGWWSKVLPEDRPLLESKFADFYQGDTDLLHNLFRAQSRKSETIWLESWAVATDRNEKGQPEGIVGVVLDRTQSKVLEEQMIASQRLESLGVMAGGIAHDFNNLLMPILGSLDVAVARHPELKAEFSVMDDAARQAAQLCEQLLTYAGRGSAELKCIDIGKTFASLKELLAVTTDANCETSINVHEGNWVKGDAGQLTQVLLNLVKNASDALEGEAGRVKVEVAQAEFDPTWHSDFHNGGALRPGPYISLKVEDSGKGIPGDEVARLFDPFFTTKFTGRGLGLAVVMGVVRGHDGGIRVTSEVGRGTTVEVVLRSEEPSSQQATNDVTDTNALLSGCVLVVDDEGSVRRIAQRLLSTIGLDSVLVEDGQSAIDMVHASPERFDAVLLDVSMPGVDGVEAANQILQDHPETQIVLCSGYSHVAIPNMLAENVEFLQKPYRLAQLKEKLSPLMSEAS